MDWTYKMTTKDEYNRLHKTHNYFTIVHNGEKDRIVDYAFWAENRDDARKTLMEFRKDHDDGKEYFYSSALLSLTTDGKVIDLIDRFPDEKENDEEDLLTDPEMRKFIIDDIKESIDKFSSSEKSEVMESYKNMSDSIVKNAYAFETVRSEIAGLDKDSLDKMSNKEINILRDKLVYANDMLYKVENEEYLIRNSHSRGEKWDLSDHIIKDLKFNLPILIKEHVGVPSVFTEKIKDEISNVDDPESDEHYEKADKLWTKCLEDLYEKVMYYQYLQEWGNFENDTDNEYAKAHGFDIFRFEDSMDFDTEKVAEKMNELWKQIWGDWMVKYGQSLWD